MAARRGDVLVVGAGLGGVAAAIAAADGGAQVLLTEPTDWIGGQLTSQGVPLDEHPWIEQFGSPASYRRLRQAIRDYYRAWYPLTQAARARRLLNPGMATVSPLSCEPRVAHAVLEAMLAAHRAAGRIELFLEHRPCAASSTGDVVEGVVFERRDGARVALYAEIVIDATELGELLALAGAEYVSGAESVADTGEPHAATRADPGRTQGFTWCFALDYHPGEDHTIERPAQYEHWSGPGAAVRAAPQIGWPVAVAGSGTLRPEGGERLDVGATASIVSTSLRGRFYPPEDWSPIADLWRFRRLFARAQVTPIAPSDITLVNWSANDYIGGTIIDVEEAVAAERLEQARQLSLSLLYWLQTAAPRADGGIGHRGLRLRGDVLGTSDGLAKAVYVRESRRIVALRRVVEQDVSLAVRGEHGAVTFPDTVGIGSYKIDLHPGASGGERCYIGCCPFQIPLGALLPVRLRNLVAAAKNIGTTHITNGCYRVHPVEWGIGEAAGALAAFCVRTKREPHQVHASSALLVEFQAELMARGVELEWPSADFGRAQRARSVGEE